MIYILEAKAMLKIIKTILFRFIFSIRILRKYLPGNYFKKTTFWIWIFPVAL